MIDINKLIEAYYQETYKTIDIYDMIHNLSLKKLANLAGVHTNTVSNWKTGKSYPNIDTCKIIAKKLGYKIVLIKE